MDSGGGHPELWSVSGLLQVSQTGQDIYFYLFPCFLLSPNNYFSWDQVLTTNSLNCERGKNWGQAGAGDRQGSGETGLGTGKGCGQARDEDGQAGQRQARVGDRQGLRTRRAGAGSGLRAGKGSG